MKMIVRAITVATTAVTILASMSAPSEAAQPAPATQPVQVSQEFATASETLDDTPDIEGDERDAAIKAATAAFDKNAVLEDGQKIADPHMVKQLEDGKAFVSAPIEGATEGSVITAVVGDNSEDVETLQISLQELTPTSGTLKTYNNGELDKDQVVHAPSEEMVEATEEGMDWKGLNRCLSNAGIASWAIAALSIVCGAACAVTAGIGCIACLAAASGATGGVIGYCVKKNWK